MIHCHALAVPCLHSFETYGTSTITDAASLASDIWDIVKDCPDAYERSICFASFGLNPSLQWEYMGIDLGFGDDCYEPLDNLDKLHLITV